MVTILLAVDGSECAQRAAAHLVEHRNWYQEAPVVHLLYVHPPIPVGLVQAHLSHETVERHYREEAEQDLASVEARLKAAGMAYQRHIHVGQPAQVIAHQAQELQVDLVLMGSHGRGAVSGALLGSVATKVLHLCERPVLLVK
ncbi:MAG TPA: universal stress protein [Azospira sp.]|nr:universal stress protein [Azospira sp.]